MTARRWCQPCVCAGVACLLALSWGRADAQVSLESTPLSVHADERPWATGVSAGEQALATDLYAAGNDEFSESRFVQALAKYQEAIQHWDHPAIHFNIAVCLINLDQPVEARDHLERSLAFGARALGAELHNQGLTYRKLLDAQLARVTITCPEPGAEITFDGKSLFTGPGVVEQFVRPGEHQVVATKAGFVTASQAFVSVAGKHSVHDIRPIVEDKAAGPRWKYWKHLVVGGSVLLAAGTASYFAARQDFADYDREFAMHCPDGCDPEQADVPLPVRAKLQLAELERVAAYAALSVAGAAVITGVIGLFADQPRTRTAPKPAMAFVTAVPGGALISMTRRF